MIRQMPTVKRPRVLCDEDECCPSLGSRVLVAFVAGAAPTVANYLLLKLDPSCGVEIVPDEKDASD